MSHHFETGAPLPDELAAALSRSKKAHVGLLNKRQIVFAMFDQYLHSSHGPVDSGAIAADTHAEFMGLPVSPGTNFAASFGHLAGGYDAAYYCYIWSEVRACVCVCVCVCACVCVCVCVCV